MNHGRQRLVAQYRNDPLIEVWRGAAGEYITEGAVRTLTQYMGLDWRHWVEKPLADEHAIGRIIRVPQGFLGRPPIDRDFELTPPDSTDDHVSSKLPPTQIVDHENFPSRALGQSLPLSSEKSPGALHRKANAAA